MGINTKTHKMLWGRSGNRCAMPECRKELVMDISETDDESLIGEECHIVAKKPNGPRGDKNFDIKKLDVYDNLVLMCRNHHKTIDDIPNVYTIKKLNIIKQDHESWVKNQLTSSDKRKQKDDKSYAVFVDKWVKLSNLDNWEEWTSFVLGDNCPKLTADMYENLQKLKEWLFAIIWLNKYMELENAFENFRLILEDFINEFGKYSKKQGELYYTEKFYKLEWHDDKGKYDRLAKQYDFHVSLVEDLIIELTRASNYICDLIRKYIDSSFRLNKGFLIISIGPVLKNGPPPQLIYQQLKAEYTKDDLTRDVLYGNLETFKEIRTKRDYCRGVGIDENDEKFLEYLHQ